MTPESESPRRDEEAARPQAQPEAQPQPEPDRAPSSGDFGGRGRGEAYIPLPKAPEPPKKRGWLVAVAAAVLAVAAAGVLRQRVAVTPPIAPAVGPIVAPIVQEAQRGSLAFAARDFDAAATSEAKRLLAGPRRDAELAAAKARLEQKRAASPEQLAALDKNETPEQRVAETLVASPEGVRAQVEKGAAGFYTFHIQAEDEGGDVIDVLVDGAPVARVITSREGATVSVPLDPKAPHVFTETLVFARDRRVYVKDAPQSAAPPPQAQTRLGIASSAGESRSGAVGPGGSESWTVQMGGGAMGTMGRGGD